MGHCAKDEWDLDHDGDFSESLGSCEGIDCAQGRCLCRPGQWRWCELAYVSLWGRQFCDEDGAAWGRCDEDGFEPPEACVHEGEGWLSLEFQTCMIEHGECIRDLWDLDGDGDTWESLGSCNGIACVDS